MGTRVHGRPPRWLQARFDRIVQATQVGEGPRTSPKEVQRFLHETWEHVREVNVLVRALGGRPRSIPRRAGPNAVLTAHDFGEPVAIRRVERLIVALRRDPPRTPEGVPIPVPDWLIRIPTQARQAGRRTVDVSKLRPEIAAGLGRRGPPDPFALRLHDLAHHHRPLPATATGRVSPSLIERVADRVNSMRQLRTYRPYPLPFSRIRAILTREIERGLLPIESRDVIRRALVAQRRLERSGAVNPYYLSAVPRLTSTSSSFTRSAPASHVARLAREGRRLRAEGRVTKPDPMALPTPWGPLGQEKMRTSAMGRLVRWQEPGGGRIAVHKGLHDALHRARSLGRVDIQDLKRAGLTRDMARRWRDFYRQVFWNNPRNTTAAGRTALFEEILRVWGRS